MQKRYQVHPDFRLASLIHAPTDPIGINALNYLNTRGIERMDVGQELMMGQLTFQGSDNEEVNAYLIQPKKRGAPLPCIIHYHGGGFMIKASPLLIRNMADYARRINCAVVIPDYNLLPNHPFPKAFNEAYDTLTWVHDHADDIGIDAKRLVISGDSAGGALAAGVTLKARDLSGPEILFQILLYPVTDYTQSSESMKSYGDAPVWDAKKNHKMWELYLTNKDEPMIGYASPLHHKNFEGLPPTYIEVAEYDCLRDEGIAYGEALKTAGNQVEINELAGGVHGYENFLNSSYVDTYVDRRIEILKRIFYG